MSYKKSDPQEYPTRVSHKSVLQECHLDISSFSNVFAFGFVGSILFNGTGGSEAGTSQAAERRLRDGLGSFSDHSRIILGIVRPLGL